MSQQSIDSMRNLTVSAPTSQRSRREVPPPIHRGMTKLDRDAFQAKVKCLAVRVDEKSIGALSKNKVVQSQILSMSRKRAIEPDPNTSTNKLLLLDVENEDQLTPEVMDQLLPLSKGFVPYEIELGYDHWNAFDILHATLPEDLLDDAPAAFTITGHIAHLNLREDYLPYKYLIGQVVLDKNHNIRTVVNKLDSIESEFRVFKMEVLAGDDDLIAEAHEAGCKFTFDFSKVYWNSRLSHEHDRLVSQYFQPGQVVADVMAGVGPFAIPAAKKRCFVLGNDLNPESTKWMEKNRVDNKVQDALRISNDDGRAFIQRAPLEIWKRPFAPLPPPTAVLRKLEKERRRAREAAVKAGGDAANTESTPSNDIASTPAEEPSPRYISHFVMNLPGSALEFLDAYAGSYAPLTQETDFPGKEQIEMPLVHVHCFTKEIEPEKGEQDILERATGHLGHPVTKDMDGYNLHCVRRVAPNKDMYCLTFRLPREVAFKA
ncbi:hypothetical protein QFC20_001516 [Naganishia adeliensis]|uniref:Uncharacterized protein n=1 Tax=Naganishia adeliensis TaxID=92952 RepID=A0ACC2WSB2_9TREE|nr:hypothetical protein QFC20_001516 [Naganishia adeliensis]